MPNNPAEEWRELEKTYRSMFDGELENLSDDMDNLTETAREVLRAEMKLRGLALPGERQADGPEAGAPGDAEDGSPAAFTWKTLLCECDSLAHALEIYKALAAEEIESWVEEPGRDRVSSIRVVVAADQLDEARAIAERPIAQDVLDDYDVPVPEYETPKCPECGEEDPVLENAEPTNAWLCEACGHQWVEVNQE